MNKAIETASKLHDQIASDVYRLVDYTIDKNGCSRFSPELEEAIMELSYSVQHLSDMFEVEQNRNDKYFVKEMYRNI